MIMEETEIMYTSPESLGLGLPPGYIFRPRQRELIEFYLLQKVMGKPIPMAYNDPVKDCDVYGDPKIWTMLFESTGKKTLYFYTKLIKKKEKGKRVVRATEFGTWRAQKDVKVYDHSDEDDEDDEEACDGFNRKEQRHIGSKRIFTFVAKTGFDPNGRWTMYEYRLDGIYGHICNNDDYVLCQINKFKKRRGFTRDNSYQVEDTATSQNLERPSLISETSTPQTGATPETSPLDFCNIDWDWAEAVSMDGASHDVLPLDEEQDEGFEAWCNSLLA